jgi:transposase
MLTTDQINDLHHLYWAERWPIRKIEQHLRMSWRTIKKYLEAPAQTPAARSRVSKLDPFKPTIAELLEKDARASAAVIEQRLRPLGYDGGPSILREYIHRVRPQPQPRRAFVRMEPEAGERFEVDWGHFGALHYEGDQRKLYAFALVDGHSRMSYLEFTHSQCFETFVRCHMHAFAAFNGVSREVFYDNLATAVAEHDGRLVSFHPRFLAFAREYNFVPRACNPASGWEKGKVERGGIGYARSWRRGQTFGAERFERELAEQRPAARRSQAQQRFLDFLDGLCAPDVAEGYLRGVADSDRVLSRQLNELLELIRQYGPEAVAGAVAKAYAARAFGADYVANILRQQQAPRRPQPPLRLRDPRLNELTTDPLSLLAYDAFILESGKEPDDAARETGSTEPVDDEPPTGDDDL